MSLELQANVEMDIWSYPWGCRAVRIWRLVNVHVHVGRVCWREKSCRVSRMEALSWSLLNGFHREDYRLAVHSEHFHQRECTISALICTLSIHHTTDGGCNAHVQINVTGQYEVAVSTITLSFSIYIHAYLLGQCFYLTEVRWVCASITAMGVYELLKTNLPSNHFPP